MIALTARQQEVFDWVAEYITTNKIAPTRREIAAGVGLSSVGTTNDMVGRLVDRGWLYFTPNGGRNIAITEEALAAMLAPQAELKRERATR